MAMQCAKLIQTLHELEGNGADEGTLRIGALAAAAHVHLSATGDRRLEPSEPPQFDPQTGSYNPTYKRDRQTMSEAAAKATHGSLGGSTRGEVLCTERPTDQAFGKCNTPLEGKG